jgi:hypothetical protein
VSAIEQIDEMVDIPGLFHLYDVARQIELLIFIERHEYRGGTAFSTGETVQYGEVGVLGERPKLIEQVPRRTVKAYIDEGTFLLLRGSHEVRTEDGSEAAGVVKPHDIVADVEATQ